ncbi:MAG: hypothetical protein R3Y15_00090 [Rikenellaceae bacterium]
MAGVYKIKEVVTATDIRQFLNLVDDIYRGNDCWVRPLDCDIEAVFDSTKNELFENGEACRWIALDEKGKVVGRIGAFYNREQAAIEEQHTGGCGFFECIDSNQVASLMFDAAKAWLESKGMEAMDGPINFGDRGSWWGVLVKGFEFPPLYSNPYNPPYYQHLFEDYGFMNYFNQHTFLRPLEAGGMGEAVYSRVKRLEQENIFRFLTIDKKRINDYAEEFRTVYNGAWAKFTGVKPIDSEHAKTLLKTMKPIIDEDLMYFAYHENNPIGFFIMMPDLNRIIGKFNGRFGLIEKLKLMLTLKYRPVDRAAGLIFGVLPEYQGKSVESGMMYAFEKTLKSKKLSYKTMELTWVGDFNPVMIRMCENYVQATKHKMHATYRYLFDRTKEFKRCPSLRLKPKRVKPAQPEQPTV